MQQFSKESQEQEEMIKGLTQEVVDQIGQNIQNNLIQVAEEPNTVGEPKFEHHKKHSMKADPTQLKRVSELKQSKLVELRQLERKEDILKKSAFLERNSSLPKLERSKVTPQEKQHLRELLTKQKNFEKKMKEKELNLQTFLEEKREEQNKLKKQAKEEQCQERRKEAKNQLDELARKKEERMLKHQSDIERLKAVKQQKCLHNQLEKRWEKQLTLEEQEKTKKWQAFKSQRKTEQENVHKHQIAYLRDKKLKEEKREQYMLEKSRSMVKMSMSLAKSKAWLSIQKQEEQQAEKDAYRKQEKQGHVIRQKLYGKKVKELFLPQLKIKPIEPSEEQNAKQTKQILNNSQMYQVGNDYMRSAHQSITKEQLEEYSKTLKPNQGPGGYSAHYQNYLKHERANKENSQSLGANSLEKVAKDSKMSQAEKLTKIKDMVKKEDRKKRKRDSQLLEQVKAKMTILQEMVGK